MTSVLYLPSCRDASARAWPRHADAERQTCAPLGALLAAEHETDAHFAPYESDVRLSVGAESLVEVRMVAMVADVDDPEAHAAKRPAASTWRDAELVKVATFLRDHPSAVAYDTRGGYRLVLPIEPWRLSDAAEWRLRSVCWLASLHRRYGVLADPTCRDWTRVYRLPDVLRDGERRAPMVCGRLGAGVSMPAVRQEDLEEIEGLAAASESWARALRSLSADDPAPSGEAQYDHGDRLPHARAYAEHLAMTRPPAVEGSGGDAATWQFLLDVYRRLALPDDDETRRIVQVFNARCLPPWEDAQLDRKVRDALAASAELGSMIPEMRVWRWSMGLSVEGGDEGAVEEPTEKPVVRLELDEEAVVDQVIAALADAQPSLYARAEMGRLVHVVGQAKPRIVMLPTARCREMISSSCTLEGYTEKHGWSPTRPPEYLVSEVLSRGDYAGTPMRRLVGVTRLPPLLPSGEVHDVPGHHAESGLLYVPLGPMDPVPERPTREQGREALERLLGILVDFPFKTSAHRSAWVAALLTPAARHAFSGCAPLMLVDANTRGTGKSLSCDVVHNLLYGEDMPSFAPEENEAEMRKRITSVLMSGAQIALIDNITGTFGSPSIDVILSRSTWEDRVLGGNETVSLPNTVTWYGTANNVALREDTARRVLHIRLETSEEFPEDRKDFKIKLICAHVRKRRAELLSCVYTILRAYCEAGMPEVEMAEWGTYSEWSRWVRAPLVWLGEEDPAATRRELRKDAVADEVSGVAGFLAAWLEFQQDCGGSATVGQCAEALKAAQGLAGALGAKKKHPALLTAAVECLPSPGALLPSPTRVAGLLRRLRSRVVAGMRLDRVEGAATDAANGRTRWRVEKIS